MDLLCSENIFNESDSSLYRLNKCQQKMAAPTIIREPQSICSAKTDPDSEQNPANFSQNKTVVCNMKEIVYIYASMDSAENQELEPRYISNESTSQSQSQQLQERLTKSNSNSNANSNSNSASPATDNVNTAIGDPTLYSDRCLENALKTEEKYHQIVDTYSTIQKDITPPMRKIVAEWMMEVCAEENCQEEVVLLALNYMDRFLSSKSVRKTHLQILAAACLLLASKLREPSCRALSVDLLVVYTDNSIYKDDLIKWELYVLSRLGWDLSSVTPLDFLELLMMRLPIGSKHFPDINIGKVRGHAQAFISLAAKEHKFAKFSASTIAASSIAASMNGLKWHLRSGHNLHFLLSLMTDLTSVEQAQVQDCMLHMEDIFKEHSRNLQPFLMNIDPSQMSTLYYQGRFQIHQSQHLSQISIRSLPLPKTPADCVEQHQQHSFGAAAPHRTHTCKMQAQAQNELQDVTF
ncbi:G1/S-specific cyclin-D2 [Drosophila rhopaloa]|uniref:G1/S-specific cyclin-D2 n=1 Tax=Drosophila rhopaloa TaxID=1041015 RepID=A0A6P4F8A2_DRORH|nr:G1/S-specific cyclin-D2 [Drosophila rhopaloa]XP_016983563.1 G1/S-specific cyclin-D2 [Drosophila rhopaloa]